MDFDVDVCGSNIPDKDYSIVVANDEHIAGFKFDKKLSDSLKSRLGKGWYRYSSTPAQKKSFKIRVYCIVIIHLLKALKKKTRSKSFFLNICRDFAGHENDIKVNLEALAGKSGFGIEGFNFCKLSKSSNADKYAYLISRDTENKISSVIKLKISDFERFLKK